MEIYSVIPEKEGYTVMKPANILVIDDEEGHRESMKMILKNDYLVFTA
ncbi:MAG: hypothetical protein HY999_04370, partial [Nitrospinae bacterium]|nr:hypothetical protein [Nitrospinota bacterium]